MDRLKDPVLLIDADILAYRAAAATDGRQYVITYEYKGQTITQYEKYKKQADKVREEILKGDVEDVSIVATYEPEPWSHAVKVMDDLITDIYTGLGPYVEGEVIPKFFYSRGGSFRERECKSYKSNRKGIRRPHHLEGLKDRLRDEYRAISRDSEFEADDLIAMEATRLEREGIPFIICTIDKDLKQIPGSHYNFVKREYFTVTEVEGLRSLYKQILTGDTADGIPGLKGVGPKTAEKLIDGLSSEWVMYGVCIREYFSRLDRLVDKNGMMEGDTALAERCIYLIRTAARLLYLVRDEGKWWDAPEMPKSEEEMD